MSDEMRELTLDHVQVWGFGPRGVRAINETGNSEAMFALLDELASARAQIEATDAACFEVCKDNTREVLGDDVDPDAGRFVCVNEDGDPIIDAATPAEVIRAMNDLWFRTSERCETAEHENRRLSAALDRTCQWKYMDFPESSSDYESECGGAWTFNDGGIEENEVKYCCRCGGRVLPPMPPSFEEEDEEEQEAHSE